MREGEFGIQLDGLAEERQRRAVALAPSRRHALAVGLERVERGRGRALNRRVVFLIDASDSPSPRRSCPAAVAEGLQHFVFAGRLHLLLLDGVAGPAVRSRRAR